MVSVTAETGGRTEAGKPAQVGTGSRLPTRQPLPQKPRSASGKILLKDHAWDTPDWTYETYIAATEFLKPLFKVYNRRCGAHKRLIVPSAESLEPWLLLDEAVAFDFFFERRLVSALTVLRLDNGSMV
jgi:hypothetical protein